jgi:electron transfer flavoprotein alpha subunit
MDILHRGKGNMKIIVCIKQVPFIDQLKFDHATKRVIREGVQSEINPFDKRAITKAVELCKQFGGETIVITMGPPQAKDALYEALAMGADRAIHLLGKEFAGADTLATARTLALACKKIGYDLILCGKFSTDAETAQVPPMLAEMLNLPQVTGATELEILGKKLVAKRETDDGFETIESSMPAVLSAAERLIKPGRGTPEDLENAKQRTIEVWEARNLSKKAGEFGLSGSPTWVESIETIETQRRCVIRDAGKKVDAVTQGVARDLIAAGLFGKWKMHSHEPIRLKPAGNGRSSNSIWVVAELIEGKIRPVTLELLGRANQLAEKIDGQVAAVLMGYKVHDHVKTLAAYGADQIYIADAASLAYYSTEAYSAILSQAIRRRKPYAVLLPSTANGRDLAPRVAARLKIGLTGDCIGLEIDEKKRLVQFKPAFGGGIVAPILTRTKPAMATIRPGMLQAAAPDTMRTPVVEKLDVPSVSRRSRVTGVEMNTSAGVEVDNAEVVIAVGMGLGGPENLPVVKELAELVHAPIMATRRVVDAGWLPRQAQVGLTGRSIAPHLYIAIGIGGKFNHMVGSRGAGIILAINNNPDAEILKQCDYGIVGDWAKVVPALTRALAAASLAI